jgi:hypothetical protein
MVRINFDEVFPYRDLDVCTESVRGLAESEAEIAGRATILHYTRAIPL